MYCPNCGNAEQTEETYCRQCGILLPNLGKLKNKEIPFEDHIRINSFFSIATAVVSLFLAITLFSIFLGREGTPWIIYLVAGFLVAMTAWQVQTFIRTRMLKKQFESLRPKRESDTGTPLTLSPATRRSLGERDPALTARVSVTENTTRNLAHVDRRQSPESQH
jgi:hypothetical protein